MIRAVKPAATAITPAAAIVRMSSSAQEKSPAEQRAEIVKLADQCGCKIVRWYEDHGVSGDNNRKRDEFNRLCRDAQRADRDFNVILAWHIDRVSRNDILDAAEWLRPLRNAGVRIITCSQGELDLDSFGGVLTYAIHQQAAHQYLRDLSRNMCRSLASRGKAGTALTRPPYAFDRVFCDASGKEVHRALCGEKFRKPKGWTATLVPSEKTELVEIVRWIFQQFTTADRSLQSIAIELNRRGKQSPAGQTWRHESVKDILANPVYAGDYVFGRSAKGKFHQVGDAGDVVSSAGRRKHKAPIVTIRNHYPAIVGRRVFQKAQERLAERRMGKRNPRSGSFPLSGILRCAHCGGKLAGVKAGAHNRYYYCFNSTKGLCIGHRVRADRIEKMLGDFVRDVFAGPAYAVQLRDEVARQIKQHGKKQIQDSAPLKATLAKLDQQIDRGVSNLLLLDPANIPAAQRMLQEKRERRAVLQAQLEAASNAGRGRALPNGQASVDRVLAQLERLGEQIQHADPAIAREAFRALFDNVSLLWHPKTGKRYALARVAIHTNSEIRTIAGNRT